MNAALINTMHSDPKSLHEILDKSVSASNSWVGLLVLAEDCETRGKAAMGIRTWATFGGNAHVYGCSNVCCVGYKVWSPSYAKSLVEDPHKMYNVIRRCSATLQ